jgi:hypothetical protein
MADVMTPASLARHSIEVAGPSVYAHKVYSAPTVGHQSHTTKWVTQIPLPYFKGHTINIFMEENFVPVPHGTYILDVRVKECVPQVHDMPYPPRNVTGNIRVAETTYANRSTVYKTLHQFVNFVKDLCQSKEFMVIKQQIADKANEMQERHSPVIARAGREWDRQAESTENYSEASAVELASVLLEISVADLAKSSIDKMFNTDNYFLVFSLMYTTFHCSPTGYVEGRDETKTTCEKDVEDIRARERSIVRFDTREWMQHHRNQTIGDIEMADIGYWTKDGEYTPPEPEYRTGPSYIGGLEVPAEESQMTPKELAIQAVGLPVMAASRSTEHGEAIRQKHYQWVSDHGYKIKLSLVELFQREPVPGMKDRIVPSYRIVIKPYVETSPTIYADLSVVTLFDEITPDKKSKMYTALWRMFQDIGAAHQAGMDPSDIIRLLGEVFYKVKAEGEDLRDS